MVGSGGIKDDCITLSIHILFNSSQLLQHPADMSMRAATITGSQAKTQYHAAKGSRAARSN